MNPSKFLIEKSEFFISGPAGKLQIMTTHPEGQPTGVGVVCHPHPMQGGTMHNKVVTTLARAYELLGCATVRFNYRGVGGSEGVFGDSVGEREDLEAVLVWVQQTLKVPLHLAGFSFGTFISAQVANARADVVDLVSIAPPVTYPGFDGLNQIQCPWLVVQGDADEVVDPQAVFAWAANPPAPIELSIMSGAGHFFHGKLIELRELVLRFLNENHSHLS